MRKISKPRKVKCPCGITFYTTHSQGKYCSPKCQRDGERVSWNKYGANNRERRRKYHRCYYKKNKEKIALRIRQYQETEQGKLVRAKCQINSILRHPEKYQARQEVLKARRKGILKKEPCKVCGNQNTQAHHPDYSKPLIVEWLCPPHHKEADKIIKIN